MDKGLCGVDISVPRARPSLTHGSASPALPFPSHREGEVRDRLLKITPSYPSAVVRNLGIGGRRIGCPAPVFRRSRSHRSYSVACSAGGLAVDTPKRMPHSGVHPLAHGEGGRSRSNGPADIRRGLAVSEVVVPVGRDGRGGDFVASRPRTSSRRG